MSVLSTILKILFLSGMINVCAYPFSIIGIPTPSFAQLFFPTPLQQWISRSILSVPFSFCFVSMTISFSKLFDDFRCFSVPSFFVWFWVEVWEDWDFWTLWALPRIRWCTPYPSGLYFLIWFHLARFVHFSLTVFGMLSCWHHSIHVFFHSRPLWLFLSSLSSSALEVVNHYSSLPLLIISVRFPLFFHNAFICSFHHASSALFFLVCIFFKVICLRSFFVRIESILVILYHYVYWILFY